MTPIKAAADPSLLPCPFCGSKIRHVESWAKSFDPPRLYHEWHHDETPCQIHYPQGGTMIANATDDPEMQARVIKEWNTRAAPAGNDGACLGDNAPCDHFKATGNQCLECTDALRRYDAYLAAHPQPREALADEIKRADAAPPEASFDNASDMLGYLNAPREADLVTPITNPLVLPAGIKAGDYASPSPIPEAPLWDEAKKLIEAFDDAMKSQKMNGNGADACLLVMANYGDLALGILRALKPQDGGDVVANEDISTNPAPRLHAFKPRDGGETKR
jgi:hypothetical protein